jgi:ribonuclease P protein component
MKASLRKFERLCKKKDFQLLFKEGDFIIQHPIKAQFLFINNNESFIKVAFAVPSRKIKKATTRNYIKRVLRESYRKQKYVLYNCIKNCSLYVSFIFIADTPCNYSQIEKTMLSLLEEIKKNYYFHINKL